MRRPERVSGSTFRRPERARSRPPFGRGPRLLTAALFALACLVSPSAVTAVTIQTFNFSGTPILGGDNPSFLPDVTVKFTFDETCMTSSCNLAIVLTYNDSGGLSSIGEALAGVSFDAFSSGSPIDLAVSLSSSTVNAESLVGAGSDDALADFGAGSNSNVDVSGHWGFISGFASSNSLGSNLLSSVGDAFPDIDAVGVADLFSGTGCSGPLQRDHQQHRAERPGRQRLRDRGRQFLHGSARHADV